MDFLNDYITLITVGICLCAGYVIKHAFRSDKLNRFIPLIMAVLGTALNMWLNLAVTPEILLGGMVSGLASTGMHEAFKQFIEK